MTLALNEEVRACLQPAGQARQAYGAVASHDEEVINFTRAYADQHGIPTTATSSRCSTASAASCRPIWCAAATVRVYVPYGTHWYPYFMRRLAERPANLLFFLRALVGD